MGNVYVKTLGCKVNTYDSHALANQFAAEGFSLTDEQEHADITVINTCSVTLNAERDARNLVRRFRRNNPSTMIVVTGCYAQINSAGLAAMDEVSLVVPNEAKERLVTLVSDLYGKRADDVSQSEISTVKLPADIKAVKDNRQSHFKSSLTLFDRADSSQTRAFLKIQDGCNGFCSYCVIPYARGASRSVAQDTVYEEIRRLAAAGVPEIVLTGIHIGDYGQDLLQGARDNSGSKPFVEFLERTLTEIPGLRRLRISSLEPRELSEDLMRLMKQHEHVFCDHLHLPLQSGSDRILKLMRRTYDSAQYRDAVDMARSYFPNICIGADVIPGFPGETETDFTAMLDFINDCQLSYLHVFPYSKRPNTAAERMPGHLPPEVVKTRAIQLRETSDKLRRAYQQKFLGQTVEVLWESSLDAEGRRIGYSRNYLEIVAPTAMDVTAGSINRVKIKGFVGENRLLGVGVKLD